MGHEAPRTPLWGKEEPGEGNKAEPVDGGEETANEGGGEWDEEAALVKRSAGSEPFCG